MNHRFPTEVMVRAMSVWVAAVCFLRTKVKLEASKKSMSVSFENDNHQYIMIYYDIPLGISPKALGNGGPGPHDSLEIWVLWVFHL